jgi:hypothetical protein
MITIKKKFISWPFKPFLLAIIALVVVCLLALIAYFEPAISTTYVDRSLTHAKLIAEHGCTWFKAESLLQFAGPYFFKAIGFLYPPGLPLALALFSEPGGLKAALLVNPLLASLAILGMFLLCGLWIGEMVSGRGCGDGIKCNNQSLCSDRNPHVQPRSFSLSGECMQWLIDLRRNCWLLAFFAGLLLDKLPTNLLCKVESC